MRALVRHVERSIVDRKLIADGSPLLLGVSGGLDSMVLLHVLHALALRHGWKLCVAHFNHQLRGRHAAADQALVGETAARLGVRFESAGADVAAFARARKISIEMAGRQLRHEFLARAAHGLGIATVALAHHADDQVELFFLRLLRGAGSVGLAGMSWRSISSADSAIVLVRPLLDCPKRALREFARQQRITFREDASNAFTGILRNRVRRRLLPLLRKEFQPAIDAVVQREMEVLRDEAQLVSSQAHRWLTTRKGRFDALPVAIQRRVLQDQMHGAGLSVDYEFVERLRLHPGEWMSVGRDAQWRRTAEGIFEERTRAPETAAVTEGRFPVVGQTGTMLFEGLRVAWRIENGRALPKRKAACEFFDADQVGNEVTLRHWRAGDRFQPIGFGKAKKLQDIFVDEKIPRNRRHIVTLATVASGEIFWVEGLRIGERFKLGPHSRRRLRWEWART